MAERTVIKEVKGPDGKWICRRYSNGEFAIRGVRYSYPNLFRGYKDSNKYSVTCLLPKATHGPAKDMLNARNDELIKEKNLGKVPTTRRYLQDGDSEAVQEKNPEYAGYWIVRANETQPPVLRDYDKARLTPGDEHRLVSRWPSVKGGGWGTLLCEPWGQNHQDHGTRINNALRAFQFTKPGEPFGDSSGPSEDEIQEAADDAFDDESQGWEDGDDEL